MEDMLFFLKQANNIHRPIAIYCAGLHGKLFYRILKQCDIYVDFFLDNSEEKWGSVIVDNVICLNPNEVIDRLIVFVCVGKNYCEDLSRDIAAKFHFEIHTITEFIDCLAQKHRELYFDVLYQHGGSEVADLIYDINANKGFVFEDKRINELSKIVVYTAVFGDYDSANYCEYLGENIDLYFVSDMKPYNLPEYYKWLDARKIIPNNIKSPIKRNRFVKMNPHKIFHQYEFSIYIDGNVVIKGDLSDYLKASKSGISVFMHPARECIFHEAISIVNFKRVNADDVCHQMKKYMNEGMPSHYGLGEMPVIGRMHNKPECINVMETWWNEFEMESQRDQLSFMYAMWKNNLKVTDLGCLGYDVRRYENIYFSNHAKESKDVKNVMGMIEA